MSIIQLWELKDVQHKHSTHKDQFVDAIKNIRTPCSYCGRTHIRHKVCPARGTFCKENVENRTTGRKSADLDSNHKGCQHHINQQPNNNKQLITPCDDPKELYFSPVTVSTVRQDEALTHISVQLPTPPLTLPVCA